MQNNIELLINLVDKQKECEFSLRYLLHNEDGSWKNFFTMLKLVKKKTRNKIVYDYGEVVLGEEIITVADGLEVISGLVPQNGEKGKISLASYGNFNVASPDQPDFLLSKPIHGILKDQYPLRFCNFPITSGQARAQSNRELLKEGLPYYPSLGEAIISFFDLKIEFFNSFRWVYVVIPDYRSRIKSLKLIFSKAELRLVTPEIKYEDLIVKVFARSGLRRTSLPDIYPESEVVKFDIGFQPDTLSAVLVSRKDNMKIDVKEFNQWSVEEEGIFVERPKEEILSLAKAGESQNIEYKRDILNDHTKNDLVETVVAFLNTNRGIILIGLDDNGNISGTQNNVEDIQKILHDCCEPPPKGIKIEEKKINRDKIILIVEVPEGENKPYQSKRDKNWYVRHNSSDYRMERSELFQMLEKQLSRNEGSAYG